MNPPAPPATMESGAVKTHPYPIILTLAFGLLMLIQVPVKASDNEVETVADAAITAQVKETLLFHLSLNFKVATNEAVVTLSGEADSVAEMKQNARLATGIPGVKRVVNNMTAPMTLAKSE